MRHHINLFTDLTENLLLEDRTEAIRSRFGPLLASFISANAFEAKNDDNGRPWLSYLDTPQARDAKHVADHTDFNNRHEFERNEPNNIDGYVAVLAQDFITHIMEYDPDPRKSLTQWMISLYLRQGYLIEDLPRLKEWLAIFHSAVVRKQMPVEKRDINHLKSAEELRIAIEPFTKAFQSSRNIKMDEDMTAKCVVLVNNATYLVVIPQVEIAAQWFGRETEWCTATGAEWTRYPTRQSMFDRYNNMGPLIIVLQKTGEGLVPLYQLHPESRQFMDVNDSSISTMSIYGIDEIDSAYSKWNKAQHQHEIVAESGTISCTYSFDKNKDHLLKIRKSWGIHSGKSNSTLFVAEVKIKNAEIYEGKTSPTLFDGAARALLIEGLNAVDVRGGCYSLILNGIQWNGEEYEDVTTAEPFLKSGDAVWLKSTYVVGDAYDMTSLCLYKNRVDPDPLAQVIVDETQIQVNRIDGEIPDLGNKKLTNGMSGYLTDLFFKLADKKNITSVVFLSHYDDPPVLSKLTKGDSSKLSAVRPDWLTPFDAYDQFGLTETVKKRVISALEKYTGNEMLWFGNSLLCLCSKDLQELKEKNANFAARSAISNAFRENRWDALRLQFHENIRDVKMAFHKNGKIIPFEEIPWGPQAWEINCGILLPADLVFTFEPLDGGRSNIGFDEWVSNMQRSIG